MPQERKAPAYRSDGAYAQLVFLHAQTIASCGWDRDPIPRWEGADEALADAQAVLRGFERYQTHPFRRFATEMPGLCRLGSVRVLDFGGSGPPVLVIPSMINRATIMDMSPHLSPLRWLARNGFRVFLLDWGEPGVAERGFGLNGYLMQRLIPALESVVRVTASPVHLVGYCMGGPLMLALAQRKPDQVRKVITLGAPWDFTAFPEHEKLKTQCVALDQMISFMGLMFGAIPPQVTQRFFALRDLASGLRKFRRFASLDPDSKDAHRFIAVEDWLNDGVSLAPKVARECLLGWLIGDSPRHGKWEPGGIPFRAEEVEAPALVVSAERDTVVRTSVSEPLVQALPRAKLLSAPVGHVGMVVGHNALQAVWKPVVGFLRD